MAIESFPSFLHERYIYEEAELAKDRAILTQEVLPFLRPLVEQVRESLAGFSYEKFFELGTGAPWWRPCTDFLAVMHEMHHYFRKVAVEELVRALGFDEWRVKDFLDVLGAWGPMRAPYEELAVAQLFGVYSGHVLPQLIDPDDLDSESLPWLKAIIKHNEEKKKTA